MDKAYDVKELVAKFKDDGLEIAEEAAKIILNNVFDWAHESALVSPNPYDNMLMILYPQIKEFIMDQAEKINPEDNV